LAGHVAHIGGSEQYSQNVGWKIPREQRPILIGVGDDIRFDFAEIVCEFVDCV
jgi:hypothetical protein